jgi:fructose-specific phosphotransferase system IIA component
MLQPAYVKVPFAGSDKQSVIKELVDLLDAGKLLLDKNVALQAVLNREQVRSTGIGSGIAIPHGKCNAVKELVVSMGIASQSIDFDSVDGKPVSIVILLLSPLDQTGPHIQALARISRLMLDESFRIKLQKASSANEVCEIFTNKENE